MAMSEPFPGGDTEPWYRQFWPWFIFSLPACVVVAGLVTVYIAIEGADDLVVDDYYKDGLAINRQLEKEQRARDLGITAQLSFSGEQVALNVSGPVTAGELTLLLSHPMEADRDFSVALRRIAPGSYQAVLPHPVGLHWHWIVEMPPPDSWRLDGSIQASDIGNAAIN